MIRTLSALLALAPLFGCATYWQASDLEEKVDLLLKNTNRETMRQIFGEQSTEITRKMEQLSDDERQKLDEIVENYQAGQSSIDEVRTSVLGTLGGGERVVASRRGVWIRDEGGNKTRVARRNTKIKNCRKLEDDEIPEPIAGRKSLQKWSWGTGTVDGETIVFPWELTMSSFAKEIVENTAKRTAQEFLRMSGDKGWRRPVYIQVTTEPGGNLTVSHDSEDIYVQPDEPGAKSDDTPSEETE